MTQSMEFQEKLSEEFSSTGLKFNPVTPDFIDHILYKIALSVRERDIDPRHSVLIDELWQYRLYVIGITMLSFSVSAERLNTAMESLSHARRRLDEIKMSMLNDKLDDDMLEELVTEAHELLANVEVAMAETTDV